MKVELPTKKLHEMLDLANRFISKNSTLPILQNVYIKTEKDKLIIRATDMEKHIEMELPITTQSDGALTVDAKTLFDIVRSIDDPTIILESDAEKDTLNMTTSKDNFTINGIPANEYVALPELHETHKISLDSKSFSTGIHKVEYAVVEKNFSPIFTGILVRLKKEKEAKKLIFVGTDSFILAEYKTEFKGDIEEEHSIIIPKSTSLDLSHIANICANEEEKNTMELETSKNLMKCAFTYDNMKISTTSVLIQGTFPDYQNEKIMPTTYNTSINIQTQPLDKAIKKIGILTRDIKNFVALSTDEETLTISSGKTDKGDWATKLPIAKEWKDTEVFINGRYINEYIKSINAEDITIHIIDNVMPVTLINPQEENYKCIIRPIQK